MSFVLEPDDDAPVGPVLPGQYVTVALPGQAAQRCYSVSGRGERTLRITVRRLGRGGLSDDLHDRLHVNDALSVAAPAGRFVPGPSAERPVVLIGAGVGVTPLLPMLRAFAAEGRETWYLTGFRDGAHHLFRTEAEQLAANPSVHLRSAYSRPRANDTPHRAGRIDASWVAGLLPVVGVPLPLVSAGGTSIVTLMAGFGILMAISTEPRLVTR